MARDTPLGKNTMWKKPYGPVHLVAFFHLFFFKKIIIFLATVGNSDLFFPFFQVTIIVRFTLRECLLNSSQEYLVPLAFFGVPDAGRHGEWLGSRQMPIRHQLLTWGNDISISTYRPRQPSDQDTQTHRFPRI
jgi:hypothetical protein